MNWVNCRLPRKLVGSASIVRNALSPKVGCDMPHPSPVVHPRWRPWTSATYLARTLVWPRADQTVQLVGYCHARSPVRASFQLVNTSRLSAAAPAAAAAAEGTLEFTSERERTTMHARALPWDGRRANYSTASWTAPAENHLIIASINTTGSSRSSTPTMNSQSAPSVEYATLVVRLPRHRRPSKRRVELHGATSALRGLRPSCLWNEWSQWRSQKFSTIFVNL